MARPKADVQGERLITAAMDPPASAVASRGPVSPLTCVLIPVITLPLTLGRQAGPFLTISELARWSEHPFHGKTAGEYEVGI